MKLIYNGRTPGLETFALRFNHAVLFCICIVSTFIVHIVICSVLIATSTLLTFFSWLILFSLLVTLTRCFVVSRVYSGVGCRILLLLALARIALISVTSRLYVARKRSLILKYLAANFALALLSVTSSCLMPYKSCLSRSKFFTATVTGCRCYCLNSILLHDL